MWDGELAAAAARRIMDLEERGFYAAIAVDVNQTTGEFAAERGNRGRMPAATLPVTHRFHEVQVLLQDKNKGTGRVICRRRRLDSEPVSWLGSDGDWEVMEDTFDLPASSSSSDKTKTVTTGVQLFAHGQWFGKRSQVGGQAYSSSETGSLDIAD
jgi:hypothetical protein